MIVDTLDQRLDEVRIRSAVAQANRHNDVTAGTASTPSASPDVGARLQKIVDDWKRRHPNGTPKATKSAPGPVLREAQQMAEAMRRARAGEALRQATGVGVGEANGNHKLPRYVVPG